MLCREDQLIINTANIGKSDANDYFWKWIDILHSCLQFLVRMGDRSQLFQIITPVFKSNFPRLTSIIDCFEMFIEAPRKLLAQAQCYNQYKKHTTVKVVISCAPLGAINFVSKCWGG